MTSKRPTFVDEFLKRWPMYMATFGFLSWIVTAIYDLKGDVREIKVVNYKDKEIIDSKFATFQANISDQNNRMNDLEKKMFRYFATIPQQIKREEE